MNALVGNFDFEDAAAIVPQDVDAPDTSVTPWGYILNGQTGQDHLARSVLARFCGMILLLAGVGLGLVPDSTFGADIFVMKLGAMLVFLLFGGVMVWYGRKGSGMELQVDTKRRELRLGNRTINGNFKLLDMLRFDEVASIYLMRNGAQGAPSRLYLRIGNDGSTGIEILRGPQGKLEKIRLKLLEDIVGCRRR